MATRPYGFDYILGHALCRHEHGVVFAVTEQVGPDEARAQVGEVDVEMAQVGLLLQGLDIDIAESLGSTIGGATPAPLCARYRRDDGDVAVAPDGEIAIGSTDEPREAQRIGAHRGQFLLGQQIHVLPPHPGHMEVEVHAAHRVDQAQQTLLRLLLG